jgi:hypothetical protein
MPCASVHMELSGRLLRRWRRDPRNAPFPAEHPRLADAFLHGAMGPDMGFVPGTDRLVSELAHYLAPGDLARSLLRRARTAAEEAFAWGWASHVLGDVELHPVVGRSVGELLHGDRGRRVDALEDVEAHVSLEVGLDLLVHRRARGLPRPPATPHFRVDGIDHLEGALRETYGLPWDRESLLRTHRRAVRLTAWWPRALDVLAHRGGLDGRRSGGSVPARLLLGLLRAVAGKGSAARGFFGVRIPPPWVLEELDLRMDGFEDRFGELVASGLGGMPNRNLETGGPAGPGLGHPASDQAARKVARLRRSAGSVAPFP